MSILLQSQAKKPWMAKSQPSSRPWWATNLITIDPCNDATVVSPRLPHWPLKKPGSDISLQRQEADKTWGQLICSGTQESRASRKEGPGPVWPRGSEMGLALDSQPQNTRYFVMETEAWPSYLCSEQIWDRCPGHWWLMVRGRTALLVTKYCDVCLTLCQVLYEEVWKD